MPGVRSARPKRVGGGLLLVLAAGLAVAACGAAPSGISGGYVRAPGGPFLTDAQGRVLVLHGVNAVEKRPPYELVPAAGRPWDFTAADAARIARLGFDVVRLGIVWEGLEPGTGTIDQPGICTPGAPTASPHVDRRTVDAYLARLRRTVGLLAARHVYTLLDMHQDVYSSVFGGEGAPPWAVCTAGNPIEIAPGRWSNTYDTAAVRAAFTAFFTNGVVGNLQGRFDELWATVARAFRDDPWVIGYDVFNEPFSVAPPGEPAGQGVVDLECFYTGRAHPGDLPGTRTPVTCPPDDPAEGVVPAIEKADPHHLVFVQPDNAAVRAVPPPGLGAMDLPRLVLEVHAYCTHRSPVTGNPTDEPACAAQAIRTVDRAAAARATMTSRRQPGGPPLVVGEFGATANARLVGQVAAAADQQTGGWLYWAWRYYDDPTGSSDEALVTAAGHYRPTVGVLAQAYAQAVAGRPTATVDDPATGTFELTYRPTAARGPTVVYVPPVAYPHGFCATAAGATVAVATGSPDVDVTNASGAAQVVVTVTAGACGHERPPTRHRPGRPARRHTAG